MLRILISVLALSAALEAAVLPEQFGSYKRGAVQGLPPQDRAVWDEFGFEEGEKATYNGPAGDIDVSAWRFRDTTGAFAAQQAQRSGVQRDNYLLQFEAGEPTKADVDELSKRLPKRSSSSLPPLFGYLPASGRVKQSERYILGASSLARFEPRISAQVAAFERGAEAQTARYRSGQNELQLTVFSYPTPQLAIERFRQFEQIPNIAARRSGTLIVVIPEAKGSRHATKLLESVNYNPKLTWNEYVPKATTQDAAKMILAISVLAAGLIVASLILGLFFGGSKVLARKFGMKPAEEDFTALHISDRSEPVS